VKITVCFSASDLEFTIEAPAIPAIGTVIDLLPNDQTRKENIDIHWLAETWIVDSVHMDIRVEPSLHLNNPRYTPFADKIFQSEYSIFLTRIPLKDHPVNDAQPFWVTEEGLSCI